MGRREGAVSVCVQSVMWRAMPSLLVHMHAHATADLPTRVLPYQRAALTSSSASSEDSTACVAAGSAASVSTYPSTAIC